LIALLDFPKIQEVVHLRIESVAARQVEVESRGQMLRLSLLALRVHLLARVLHLGCRLLG
jgi:hypothetical protein